MNTSHVSTPMSDFFNGIQEKTEKDMSGYFTNMQTHHADLDEMTGGLEIGLTLLAGRPGVGKTAFALSMALQSCLRDKNTCIFFSLESVSETLAKRMLSFLSGVDLLRIQTGRLRQEDCDLLVTATEVMAESKMYIDHGAITIDDIENSVTDKEKLSPRIIVVDSLQMLENHNPRTTRYRNLNEIILRLKKLAFKYGSTVILTSQLHKRLEMRADKRPYTGDFSETEFPAHAADKVLFLYRDEMYNENTSCKGLMEVICAKNKTGPIGKIRVKYLPPCGRYEDFKRE